MDAALSGLEAQAWPLVTELFKGTQSPPEGEG